MRREWGEWDDLGEGARMRYGWRRCERV
jgi:hypothetical protein